MFKVALVHIDEPEPHLPAEVPQRLEAEGIGFTYRQCVSDTDVNQVAAAADLVWVYGGGRVLTPASLSNLKGCRAILRTGSGTDNIPVEEASALGILVVNTPQATIDPVSDHAIALMLSVFRWIPRQDRAMRKGQWHCEDLKWNWHLTGSVIGLVGFGRIAQALVRKLTGFQFSIMAYDPHVSRQSMDELGVRKSALQDILRQADILSLHTPLTPETHHLIGEREFGLMKPNAVLINTSRGQVMDEQSLVRALTEGRIAAAGIDVFENSPPPADNPLRRLENVVITPHVASESDQINADFWWESLEAIGDIAQGRLPASYVNPQVAERSGFTSRDF